MCWDGGIEGQLIIHWFDNNVSVNGQIYLDMVKEKVCPKIRNIASRRMYWFQQDGWSSYTHYKWCKGMVKQYIS